MYVPVNKDYYRREEELTPYEISVSRNSEIRLLGKYALPNSVQSVTITNIQDCVMVEGRLSLEGFTKVTFAQMATTYSSFRSGVIVNGIHKLRVHVVNFRNNPELIEGAHVKCIGEIKRDKFDSIFLYVEDIDDITKIDDSVLPHEELKKGIYTPKKEVWRPIIKNSRKPPLRKRKYAI